MNAKFAIAATLVGGTILFFWGFITHSVIPEPVIAFTNDQAVVDAMKANAPANGVYFSGKGVLAAVSFEPDMRDKTENITANLIREFLSCGLTALLLSMVLLGARSESVLGGAVLLAFAAVAAALGTEFSSWNWYGMSPKFIGIESLDLIGGWFLTGLALGPLRKRLAS
jgi:hypothetical protein